MIRHKYIWLISFVIINYFQRNRRHGHLSSPVSRDEVSNTGAISAAVGWAWYCGLGCGGIKYVQGGTRRNFVSVQVILAPTRSIKLNLYHVEAIRRPVQLFRSFRNEKFPGYLRATAEKKVAHFSFHHLIYQSRPDPISHVSIEWEISVSAVHGSPQSVYTVPTLNLRFIRRDLWERCRSLWTLNFNIRKDKTSVRLRLP